MRVLPSALYVLSSFLKVANSEDEFKGCTLPSFEWATYSTRTTARMYGMRGALSGGNVFAAGFVKSTIDSNTTSLPGKEFTLTGPYSVADPTGIDAETIEVDLMSYPAAVGAGENAGGSFGQYEVGVAKIDASTGEPRDFFVYGGDGLDETSGIAAKDESIAISGHFTGNLTVVLIDDSSKTIWNTNIEEGGVPDQADQFHPNQKDASAHTGVDDGFVIKARAEDGKADWIVRYPESNKDSQIIGVDLDDSGNVFGSGYKCSQGMDADTKVCDGVVAKMRSADGSIEWETPLPELGAAFQVKYDSEDESLYVTGTTTYGGSAAKDGKDHGYCEHDSCSVVLRLSATDGSVHWERTVKGSPRWGVFDQNGDIELATEADGPYIYVMFDDTGEGSDETISLDAGTPYAICMDGNGSIMHEFEVRQDMMITSTDCPPNYTYYSRSDPRAVAASQADTNAQCGGNTQVDACLIKYHKYTGLPQWGTDIPPAAGVVPSQDGASVHVAGWYYPGRAAPFFDTVLLPGYLRDGGLGSQTSGVFNAKLSSATGKGEYVVHSGGGSKDRLYDVVGDIDGNIYNIGYSMNLVMNWGNNLKTTMTENDVDQADAGTEAAETHMYVSKLLTASETTPSCLTACSDNTDTATIDTNSCFIDGKCYANGDSGAAFGKSCFVCDPSKDQRSWVEGETLGSTQCYIGGTCVNKDDAKFYQRRTWSEKIFSECQVCDPMEDKFAWTPKLGYIVDAQSNPPTDCTVDESKSEDSSHDHSNHTHTDNGNTEGGGESSESEDSHDHDNESHDHGSHDSKSQDHGSDDDKETSSGDKTVVFKNTALAILWLMCVMLLN